MLRINEANLFNVYSILTHVFNQNRMFNHMLPLYLRRQLLQEVPLLPLLRHNGLSRFNYTRMRCTLMQTDYICENAGSENYKIIKNNLLMFQKKTYFALFFFFHSYFSNLVTLRKIFIYCFYYYDYYLYAAIVFKQCSLLICIFFFHILQFLKYSIAA